MPQFLAETIDPVSGEVRLAPGEDRHLLLACRGRIGETVLLFDGRGTQQAAVLEGTARGRAILRAVGPARRPPEPARRLLLLQGIPARPALEAIITAAVELGVSRILPVVSERTSRPPRGFVGRGERWRALVLAAAKQCLRPDLPVVDEPSPLDEAAGRTGAAAGVALGGPSTGASLTTVVSHLAPGRDVALAIGPEGGWTEGELAGLAERGFVPASLGPLILRCETAAVVALGVARLAGGAGPER